MFDERGQEIGPPVQAIELLDQHSPQLPRVLGGEIRQPGVLGVLPHILIRIGLRGIGRQGLGVDLGVPGQVRSYPPRTVMDVRPIPEDRHRPAEVLAQLAEERHDVLGVGVGIVGQQAEVQPQVPPFGTDGHGAEGRDAVVPAPGPQNRRLAPRGQCTADRGREHEATLVEEDEVGLAAAGASDDPGQFLAPSVLDGDFVTLLGLALGLLAGPAELMLEDLADVLGMEADVEMTANQLGSSIGGPQFGAPAMDLGASEQQRLQAAHLIVIEPGRPAGVALGGELLGGLLIQLQPGVDGGAGAAQEAGDLAGMLAFVDKLNGAAAPTFEFFCSSYGSHTHSTPQATCLFV
jgi:hypothetical protein